MQLARAQGRAFHVMMHILDVPALAASVTVPPAFIGVRNEVCRGMRVVVGRAFERFPRIDVNPAAGHEGAKKRLYRVSDRGNSIFQCNARGGCIWHTKLRNGRGTGPVVRETNVSVSPMAGSPRSFTWKV